MEKLSRYHSSIAFSLFTFLVLLPFAVLLSFQPPAWPSPPCLSAGTGLCQKKEHEHSRMSFCSYPAGNSIFLCFQRKPNGSIEVLLSLTHQSGVTVGHISLVRRSMVFLLRVIITVMAVTVISDPRCFDLKRKKKQTETLHGHHNG